jgi:hypothetical protein
LLISSLSLKKKSAKHKRVRFLFFIINKKLWHLSLYSSLLSFYLI